MCVCVQVQSGWGKEVTASPPSGRNPQAYVYVYSLIKITRRVEFRKSDCGHRQYFLELLSSSGRTVSKKYVFKY